MLTHDLESLLSQKVPLQIYTDAKSLFDVITKSSTTSEKRLMIDVQAAREACERYKIADIGLVRSDYNLVDCLTKVMLPKQLLQVVSAVYFKHPIEQYIICTIPPTPMKSMSIDKSRECRRTTKALRFK